MPMRSISGLREKLVIRQSLFTITILSWKKAWLIPTEEEFYLSRPWETAFPLVEKRFMLISEKSILREPVIERTSGFR